MSTQHFGIATVVPRSIAWLVRLDDWDHFETVVNYNCAMIGGYFNVLIPVADDNSLPMPYQRFLLDYDPALIILAPGMSHIEPQSFEEQLIPFGIISWDAVSQVAELDPGICGSGMNPNVMALTHHDGDSSKRVLIAVAQEERPDTSWRAFVACGDVKPEEPMWQVMDDDIDLDATGHREMFLSKGLKESLGMYAVEANPDYTCDSKAPTIIPAPDRYRLRDIIAEEHQFPLSGAADILEACCALQHRLSRQSFVGLTASYAGPTVMIGGTSLPFVVLVSDSFGLEEAVLFWNLRANDTCTVWLSFSEIEDDLEAIAKWLGSDYGGGLYVVGEAVFSAAKCDLQRLHDIVGRLEKVRVRRLPHCKIVNRDDLINYNYVRPHLIQEQVMIVEDQSRCTFIPRMPANSTTGVYVVILDWQSLMLPPNRKLVSMISQDTIGRSLPRWIEGHSVRLLVYRDGISMPRFRINCNRNLEVQVESEAPINFTKPSLAQIVEVLFKAGGFSRVVQSSAAKYHLDFVQRSGGLEEAASYLSHSPYRELFELLADSKDNNKIGWIRPEIRKRVLHNLHLRDALGASTPCKTREYFNTVSDKLPEPVIELLGKRILERGILLKCEHCSFESWYPAEHLGQTFECYRCQANQVCRSNPLWLYKLQEVVFQGFAENMQVPLLALHYLERTSRHNFEWLPDSDVYWDENGSEQHKNVDILCLCDGRLMIGEAKSNDNVPDSQFSFYKRLCQKVAVDAIVFATTESNWRPSTLQRIQDLRRRFRGQVISLTANELYASIGCARI